MEEIVKRMLMYDGEIIEKYRRRLITIGGRVTVQDGGGDYEAYAVDIDDIGRLIVRTDDGCVKHLQSGEVSITS
jgi:BirA family biotin operon repressor/biotin-[acetyl-CoA-carboxylase] ligase